MGCKKYSKLVNTAKKKQIHRYREHINKLMVITGGKGNIVVREWEILLGVS